MALEAQLHSRGVPQFFGRRQLLAIWLVALAFLGLLVRLYGLQVIRGDEYTSKGRRNFVQRVRVPHDRGIIYDRRGNILVDNRPSLDLYVTPAFLGNHQQTRETLDHLQGLLNLSHDHMEPVVETVRSRVGLARFRPVLLARDLSPEQVEAIESERSVFLLDGVDVVEGRRRTYRYGALAAHLLGYVNEIDARGLARARAGGNPAHYELGDLVGRDGVERTFEDALRGRDGVEKIVVDAKGRRQQDAYIASLLGQQRGRPPQPGHNLVLTLDFDLQRRTEDAFTGNAGSIIIVDVRTGAVRALVSKPAFDPNRVSGALGIQEKRRLDVDPLKPWVNRAIQGLYAPGSTFKPITALAGMAERSITAHESVRCPGYFRMGRHKWRCHRDWGHGGVRLKGALKKSCDTYFYTIAARIGINPIASMSRLFGMGARTGIDLLGEKVGLVPDEAFHDRADRQTGGYQRGMAVNTSIGQGSLLATPIQMVMLYAALANGGAVLKPQIIDRIETADFRVARRFLPEVLALAEHQGYRGSTGGSSTGASVAAESPLEATIELTTAGVNANTQPGAGADSRESGAANPQPNEPGVREDIRGKGPTAVKTFPRLERWGVPVPPEFLEDVHEGLVAVTSERGGTAYWRRSRTIPMAGKTGTAQVVRLGRERLKSEETPYDQRDHAWFTAYAPLEEPEIAVVVINEHAGHGSSHAAPIAVAAIDAYFELKATRLAAASGDSSSASALGSGPRPVAIGVVPAGAPVAMPTADVSSLAPPSGGDSP